MVRYILDTNVLMDLAQAMGQIKNPIFNEKESNREKTLQRNTIKFFFKNKNQIIIPDIVWAEFQGVFLHKDINMDNPQMWFRDRTTIVQQMEEMFRSASLDSFQFWVPQPDNLIYSDAQILTQDQHFIQECIQDRFFGRKLKDRSNKQNNALISNSGLGMKGAYIPGGAKILDGMDAVILAYAIDIATSYKDDICLLYTGDNFLFQGYRVLQKMKQDEKDEDFPLNLHPVASLFIFSPSESKSAIQSRIDIQTLISPTIESIFHKKKKIYGKK
jgi:hypothetical protein